VDTDLVSWLSPHDPNSIVTKSAKKLRNNSAGELAGARVSGVTLAVLREGPRKLHRMRKGQVRLGRPNPRLLSLLKAGDAGYLVGGGHFRTSVSL
jgi:hypothetical protein